MPKLAIYTNSFPYGKEETFLESEVACLSCYFEEIFIVPFRGNGYRRTVPINVTVLSPVQEKKWPGFIIYFVGMINFHRIFKIPEFKKELTNFTFIKCLRFIGYAILTKRKLELILPYKSSIHYSYWLNFNAFALSLIKMDGKIKTIIGRTHGYDLYDDRGEKGLRFIRGATIKNLDKLFFISDHGLNYLLKKFPEYSEKFCISRLGTSDPEFINPVPDKNGLTLVSCSAINSNKRVYLILESLILFQTRYPAINVNWYHFGSGRDILKYVEKADASFKNSLVNCFFPGQLTNPEIFDFYKSVPVDFFVNVSENEGIPVSIMEAQSFSIPVVATKVGGTSEIVNDENGLLIQANPLPDELASIFNNIYKQKEIWGNKRSISRIFWENNYCAEKNYTIFSQDLLALF